MNRVDLCTLSPAQLGRSTIILFTLSKWIKFWYTCLLQVCARVPVYNLKEWYALLAGGPVHVTSRTSMAFQTKRSASQAPDIDPHPGNHGVSTLYPNTVRFCSNLPPPTMMFFSDILRRCSRIKKDMMMSSRISSASPCMITAKF